MAQSSVMLSVPQLVDLALNSPEMGVINFNMLHALLHVLVQQLDLAKSTVEFRGINGDKVQNLLNSTKPAQAVSVSEYVVNKEGSSKKQASKPASAAASDTIILVETVTESISTPHVSVAFSKSQLQQIHDDMDELRQKVRELAELPSNLDLINASRDKSQPIVDMFQILSLNKRIGATEEGVRKLASMLQDLARNTPGAPVPELPPQLVATPAVTPAPSRRAVPATASPAKGQQNSPAKGGNNLGGNQHTQTKMGNNATPSASPPAKNQVAFDKFIPVNMSQFQDKIQQIENAIGMTNLTDDEIKALNILQAIKDLKREISEADPKMRKMKPAPQSAAHQQPASQQAAQQAVQQAIQQGVPSSAQAVRQSVAAAPAEGVPLESTPTARSSTPEQVRVTPEAVEPEGVYYEHDSDELDEIRRENTQRMKSMENMFRNELEHVTRQMNDMELVVNNILEKLDVSCPQADSDSEIEATDVLEKLTQLQDNVENLIDTANKLIADKEERDSHMNAMMDEIELLKTIKADREDLEDALADKADACAVNRKVSHDQFDAACDDLSKGIEEALSKLTQQETLWQQALDDIQREMGNKLDKSELIPLRDFINSKLKMLQDKVKDLSKMRKEAEAAGVKSRYLKDVNCISCDKDVIMRKQIDPVTMPKAYALPPNKSMAPYLAYELDQLRKQQKCFPHSKNVNNLEKAMNVPKGAEDHICNRYCGGSHTVTTPQQRVTRLGHFVQQWGMGVLPMDEGTIRGTDGQMYKSTEPDQPAKKTPRESLTVQGGAISSRKPSKGGDGDSATAKRDSNARRSSADKKQQRSSKSGDSPRTSKENAEGKQPLIRKSSASSAAFKKGSQSSTPKGTDVHEEGATPEVVSVEASIAEEAPRSETAAGEEAPTSAVPEAPVEGDAPPAEASEAASAPASAPALEENVEADE